MLVKQGNWSPLRFGAQKDPEVKWPNKIANEEVCRGVGVDGKRDIWNNIKRHENFNGIR